MHSVPSAYTRQAHSQPSRPASSCLSSHRRRLPTRCRPFTCMAARLGRARNGHADRLPSTGLLRRHARSLPLLRGGRVPSPQRGRLQPDAMQLSQRRREPLGAAACIHTAEDTRHGRIRRPRWPAFVGAPASGPHLRRARSRQPRAAGPRPPPPPAPSRGRAARRRPARRARRLGAL